jgi:hypothetical protein
MSISGILATCEDEVFGRILNGRVEQYANQEGLACPIMAIVRRFESVPPSKGEAFSAKGHGSCRLMLAVTGI